MSENKLQYLKVSEREYNSAREEWGCFSVTQDGQTQLDFSTFDKLRNKRIIGIVTRKQDGEGKICSAKGNPLISNAAMNNAFITFRGDGCDLIWRKPLSHFAHDCLAHTPGTFAQILLASGFDHSDSYITFSKPDEVKAGTDVEIGFIYIDDVDCRLVDPCVLQIK